MIPSASLRMLWKFSNAWRVSNLASSLVVPIPIDCKNLHQQQRNIKS
jgi:hypothetical protein